MSSGLVDRPRGRDLLPLLAGLGVLAVGTALGWDARLVDAVVTPPPILRAALLAASAVLGGAFLVAALRRIGDGSPSPADAADRGPDLRAMIRGIRLAFLALAAFAAAAGWAIGHPLPIVVACIIAGVDIVETGFLLLVVGRRR